MKKILFATVAMAAALVMGDAIESTNIVGYKNQDVGAFTLSANTFRLTGGSEAMTLGDIKPNENWEDLNDTIQLFSSAGQAGTVFVYLADEELAAELETTVGWYDFNDDECQNCLNSTSLPFTQGFVAKSGNAGAALVYAGEVKLTDAEIPVGAFTLTANSTPKDLTLGEIVPNANWEDLNDTIQVFTAAGQAGTVFVYLADEELAAELETSVGWYDFNDDECQDCLNSTPIPSGYGFVAKSNNLGAALVLPSPVK